MILYDATDDFIYHYMAWCDQLTDSDTFLKVMTMLGRNLLDIIILLTTPIGFTFGFFFNFAFIVFNLVLYIGGPSFYYLTASEFIHYLGYTAILPKSN